jgi:hypothetical protein
VKLFGESTAGSAVSRPRGALVSTMVLASTLHANMATNWAG